MNASSTKPIGEFISAATISKRVKELAEMINTDFKDQEVIIIGVLNGSFILMFRHKLSSSH